MEKRITLYIAFWGSLIMSCVTEYNYMQVLWLVGAVFFVFDLKKL